VEVKRLRQTGAISKKRREMAISCGGVRCLALVSSKKGRALLEKEKKGHRRISG